MFISQTAEEIKQSLMVNANTAINVIRLAEATLWSVSPDKFDPEMTVESEVRYRPGTCRRSDGSVFFGINFKFTVRRSQEESTSKPQELIKISCTLEADYSLNPKFDPTTSQLKAFHHGNAVFNCWPYFREFVQNSSLRMHLPPPPVPFLRLMPPKKDGEKPKQVRDRKVLKEGASD
jgi:hypothetical protein